MEFAIPQKNIIKGICDKLNHAYIHYLGARCRKMFMKTLRSFVYILNINIYLPQNKKQLNRPQPITSEANRMVFLFELYEYIWPVFTKEKPKKQPKAAKQVVLKMGVKN